MAALFNQFLIEVGKILLFPSLTPDAQGACLIIMKDTNIPLLFEFDNQLVPNTILLSSPITSIPTTYLADVCRATLVGNRTMEETLSIKLDEDMVYLHRRLHPAVQASELELILKEFLALFEKWKEGIERLFLHPPQLETFPPYPYSIQIFPYKT